MVKIGCRISQWDDARFKYEEYDTTAPPDIVKKINLLHDRWKILTSAADANPVKPVMDVAEVNFWHRLNRIGTIVEAGRYQGARMRKALETRALNILGRIRGVHVESLTRRELVQFSRRARGMVSDIFADLEVAKYADELWKTADSFNLTKEQKAIVIWDAIELGSSPYLLDTVPYANEPAVKWIQARRDNAISRMQEFGLRQRQVEDLLSKAKDLAQANAEIPKLASASLGIDIASLEKLGYMERIFTVEANDVLNTINNGGIFNKEPMILKSIDSADAAFKKGRQFFDFITEDAQVLDYFFTKAKLYDKLNDKLQTDDVLRASLGKNKITGISDLLEEGSEPILLHGLINVLDQDDMQFLIESGFISKIPWETTKVHEWMVKNYKFPFEGINDIYLSDPRRAVKVYQDQLTALAAQSGKVWGIFNDAINNGWGVPPAMLDVDPVKYKGYVSMRDAFPTSIIDKFLGKGESLDYFLDNTFVDPRIAKVIKADFTLVSSPFWSSMLGQTLNVLKKWSSGLMLGSPAWMGRQIIGWSGSVMAQGANPMRFMQHFQIWAFAKTHAALNGISHMDYGKWLNDTKKIYINGTLSERELWKAAVKKGLINDFNIFGEGRTVNKMSLSRTVREWGWYMKNYGLGGLGNLVAKGANDLTDANAIFQFLSWGNIITDNFGRFTILEHYAKTGRFKDVNEAIEYVFQHTWNFDNIAPGSIGTNKVVQTFVPFINWRLSNAQQLATYLVEHPHRFGTYLYLQQRQVEDFKENHPDEWSTIADGWITDLDFPVVWSVDAESSGTGKEEFFVYTIPSIMPYLSPIGDIGNVLDVAGLFNSSEPPHRRNDIPKEMRNPYKKQTTALRRLIKEETMPFVELAVGHINQEDNWGNSFETLREKNKKRQLLGIPIDPVIYWSITTAFPVTKYPDRVLSHTGALGQSGYLNPVTGSYTEPQPNYLGITPDYQTSAQKPSALPPGLDVLGEALGFAPYNIDVYWSQGYTTEDVRGMVKNGKKWLNSAKFKYKNAVNDEERARIVETIQEVAIWSFWMEVELAYLEKWRKQVGLPNQAALKLIERENRKLTDLLPDQDKTEIRAIIWEKYKNYVPGYY